MKKLMKNNRIRESVSDRVFGIVVKILLAILFVIILYPIWFVLIASISDQSAVSAGKVILWPEGLTFEGYKRVLSNADFYTGMGNTIIYTVVGTVFNVIVTVSCAYALSRKDLKGRGLLMGLFVVTMYFGGGMIPGYLNVKEMGLTNSRFIMVLMGLVTPYNLIVCRTFLSNSIPWELHEAAFIDGASDFQIFRKIIVPLSKPIISVMVIYYGVTHWNDYFNAMLYLRDEALFPLQLFLREILLKSNINSMMGDINDADTIISMIQEANVANQLKYATIVVSTAPILAVYPFLEKHFEKGVMIGSVKG